MALTEEQRGYLESIWTNVKHTAAFSGPYKLYQIVKKEGKHKIGLKGIREFLSDLEPYSLQKRVQRKFPRRHILTDSIDTIWDGDLQDVRNISKDNEGVQYILVLQDIFSRYLFTAPLKQKTATNMIEALKTIFASGRKPEVLRTDKGKEFKNHRVASFLKDEDVHQIFTENETKSNFAERSIQNLENRLHRMFTHNQSYEFLSKLQSVTDNINNTPSRPLGGITPASVTKKNVEEVRYSAYLQRNKKKSAVSKKLRNTKKERKRPFKFKLNDKVRISHLRRLFQREYDQKWTGEIFKVSGRYRSQGLPVYKLKDFAGEPILGTFYAQELQKVRTDDNSIWKIDKILQERKRKGTVEVLVSWHQWPAKFNSWIKKSVVKEV